ncbi:serine protease [Patescibacteria group bacterium]|nr:MAG: serine protease [Patescibacteria group bacterium]
MEDLNKTQLILLTLLVSFVTSIATGIITVSLLQEAPANVTQTINRVVEKTIERVVPAEGTGERVKEVTVVVKEEDLVIDAIGKNSKAVVRIKDNALIDGVSPFYGLGFLVNKDGIITSAYRETLNPGSTYTATFADGAVFTIKVVHQDGPSGLVFFRILTGSKVNLPVSPVAVAETEPKLGQTVITIEGEGKDIVAIGRVTSFGYVDEAQKQVFRINSDILPKSLAVGGPLVNLSGEVVGVRISGLTSDGSESFISLTALKQGLTNVPK